MIGVILHLLMLHYYTSFSIFGWADILPYNQVYVDQPGAGAGHFGFSTEYFRRI